jgi:hypothetical protein
VRPTRFLGYLLALLAAVALGISAAHAAPTEDHQVFLGNDGVLLGPRRGVTGHEHMRRVILEVAPREGPKGFVLVAHGALVSRKQAELRVKRYRKLFLPHGLYPIVLTWNSDLLSTFRNILTEKVGQARRVARRVAGLLRKVGPASMFGAPTGLASRMTRLGGVWSELKENAMGATTSEGGGAALLAQYLARERLGNPALQIHLVGHSAGTILLAPFVQLLTTPGVIRRGPLQGRRGHGLRLQLVELRGGAAKAELFEDMILPALRAGRIQRLALVNLRDRWEREDDEVPGYDRSILYLVRQTLEKGKPALIGLQATLERIPGLRRPEVDTVACPRETGRYPCQATTHGRLAFDPETLRSTLRRALETPTQVRLGPEAPPRTIASVFGTGPFARRPGPGLSGLGW